MTTAPPTRGEGAPPAPTAAAGSRSWTESLGGAPTPAREWSALLPRPLRHDDDAADSDDLTPSHAHWPWRGSRWSGLSAGTRWPLLCALALLAVLVYHQTSRTDLPALRSPSSASPAAAAALPFALPSDSADDPTTSKASGRRFPSHSHNSSISPLMTLNCEPPYLGFPYCESRVHDVLKEWISNPYSQPGFSKQGVDGSKCSILDFWWKRGYVCPQSTLEHRTKIRGVNLGGWLVLEPWIAPSLFEQFQPEEGVKDQWTFCERLGPDECRRQLSEHWDTWLTFDELEELADAGINHVRLPVGYWILGDVRAGEPWVTGDLAYLDKALQWCAQLGLHVLMDMHCAPGSQNGFDNSGHTGPIRFAEANTTDDAPPSYPNIERMLDFIGDLTAHVTDPRFHDVVVGIELVNEAFVTIPIEVVKDFYMRGYLRVRANSHSADVGVLIGDSFRFAAWRYFMAPPHYRHVWIDTHIYQVFDLYRLSYSWDEHIQQTCRQNRPEVAVSPLPTVVGEWSLATTDCARWLNGFGAGARFDGTFSTTGHLQPPLGSCRGQHDLSNTEIWTAEYRRFLRQFAEAQMDAYESGSSAGWFFWNFKTEEAPQWDYLRGLREGWIPSSHHGRTFSCQKLLQTPF